VIISAFRRTARVLDNAPEDGATASAVTRALLGLPHVPANRRVVPPHVERGLRQLEIARRGRTARNYVG
jgi:hypothetical protein